jgi:hypothetical protein
MPVEIHQQERQVVQRIDGGELLVEFDRVVEHRLPVPEHDVPEMEVAVAAPHAAAAGALLQRRLGPAELGFGPAAEVKDGGGIEHSR